MPNTIEKLTIRGVDADLYQKARIDAVKKKLSMGRWLNEAIKLVLGGTNKIEIIDSHQLLDSFFPMFQ